MRCQLGAQAGGRFGIRDADEDMAVVLQQSTDHLDVFAMRRLHPADKGS